MWDIYGSRSEYLEADAEEADRHRLVWEARMIVQNEKLEEAEEKTAEAEHDAQIGW